LSAVYIPGGDVFYIKYFTIILVCVCLSSCTQRTPQQKYEETNLVYGEKVAMDVCVDPHNPGPIHEAMGAAWDEVNHISSKLGRQDKNSDIYKINHSFGHPVKVSDDMYDLVREAVSFTPLSKGTFDITVGALEDLWKESGKQDRIPTREEVKDIQKAMGVKWIQFNPDRTIELANPKTSIDLGGLAGGWAVDKAARIFQRYGYRNFMVAAAGAMYMSGHNCDGKSWQIGISNPLSQNNLMDMLSISDGAVDTSGDYEKYLIINGQKYSHIYNPITGYPQKGTTSATVIAKTTLVKTGVLTVACCILSPQEAIKMIDRLGPGYAALIMYKPADDQIIPYESQYYKEYKNR